MDPNDLRERVKGEIEVYIDRDAWEQHQRVEEAQRETVKSIAKKMSEVVA